MDMRWLEPVKTIDDVGKRWAQLTADINLIDDHNDDQREHELAEFMFRHRYAEAAPTCAAAKLCHVASRSDPHGTAHQPHHVSAGGRGVQGRASCDDLPLALCALVQTRAARACRPATVRPRVPLRAACAVQRSMPPDATAAANKQINKQPQPRLVGGGR